MQRLSLNLLLAVSLSIAASGVLAAERQEANLLSSDRSSIIAQANNTGNKNNFVAVEHPTQGQAKIVEVDGQRYLEFSQNFKTDSGPALAVILHRDSSVALNIQPDSYVSLGKLQTTSGIQRYLIPNELDLAGYQSVAIWCERFNATFGYAPLAR